jgi:hypothetical protein
MKREVSSAQSKFEDRLGEVERAQRSLNLAVTSFSFQLIVSLLSVIAALLIVIGALLALIARG